MIVRILEDGQFEVDDKTLAHLEALDAELESSLAEKDEKRFSGALSAIIDAVHSSGTRLDTGALRPSELVIPAARSTMDEVESLLESEAEDGLVDERGANKE